VYYSTINSYSSASWQDVLALPSQAEAKVIIMWRVPFSAGNEIQGDSVSFDMSFYLR
jgi:hypothetical protein